MTGRVLPLNASEHAAVDALLPWYVNGTLRGEELERVERHVAACRNAGTRSIGCATSLRRAPRSRRCRMRRRPRVPLPSRARRPDSAADVADSNFPGLAIDAAWTRMLIAAQFAGLAILGTLLALETRNEPSYRTLGASRGRRRRRRDCRDVRPCDHRGGVAAGGHGRRRPDRRRAHDHPRVRAGGAGGAIGRGRAKVARRAHGALRRALGRAGGPMTIRAACWRALLVVALCVLAFAARSRGNRHRRPSRKRQLAKCW